VGGYVACPTPWRVCNDRRRPRRRNTGRARVPAGAKRV